MLSDDQLTVFIISVINCPETPDSYNLKRSTFSWEQRLAQTLETVKSVRKQLPRARVILFEAGKTDAGQRELSAMVDNYIYLGHKKLVKLAVGSRHKSLGEAVICLYSARYLASLDTPHYIKLSGRYFLSPDFSLRHWRPECFNFKNEGRSVSTRAYGVPRDKLVAWILTLVLNLFAFGRGKRLERVLFNALFIRPRNYIDRLSVAGLLGPNGDKVEE
jgi:hypothetical protein